VLGFEPVDVWAAVIYPESADQTVLGVYTTQELAVATAERVAPEDAEATHFVLDEVPEWIDGFEQETRRRRADLA
jgi:hypothetical protein